MRGHYVLNLKPIQSCVNYIAIKLKKIKNNRQLRKQKTDLRK